MNVKYLWYGVGIVMVLLGLSFLNIVGITPEMLDEGLESIRVVDPDDANVKVGTLVDNAIHDFAEATGTNPP